jgi:hypothetical protein
MMARVGFLWFIRFMRTFDLIIRLKWALSELAPTKSEHASVCGFNYLQLKE